MLVFSRDEKLQMIKWYYGGNSFRETINLFIVAFENRPIPAVGTVRKIIQKFENSGCLNVCKKCQPPSEHNVPMNIEREQREVEVCALVETSEPCSSRKLAEELDMSGQTVRDILKRNKYRCYKVEKTQEIFAADRIRRMEFCETMIERANGDELFISNILFGDESSFSLHGHHNPSITRYWSRKNKHLSVALRTQYPEKLNTWAGILGDFVIGPFYINGNLNGAKYLELLNTQIIPAVRALPGIDINNTWFQQDGCPAHNTAAVRESLEAIFHNRLISSRGTILWPPRSPDLAPNDFFLWGYLKGSIYKHRHERAGDLQELRIKINNALASVTPQMLLNVRRSFYDRLGYCLAQEGGIFEPLI